MNDVEEVKKETIMLIEQLGETDALFLISLYNIVRLHVKKRKKSAD